MQPPRNQPARILAASFYAATSMRNVIWGVIEPWLQCASRAPGTIVTPTPQQVTHSSDEVCPSGQRQRASIYLRHRMGGYEVASCRKRLFAV
jgi:hypothetical protein